MPAEKLQIGIIIDDYKAPRWVFELFSRLKYSDYAVIQSVVLNGGERAKQNSPHFSWLSKLVYALHEWIDKLCYFKKDKLVDLVSLDELLNSVEVEPNKGAEYLDVTLNASKNEISVSLLSGPKYGIWEFRQNFERQSQVVPSYWETTQRHPETVTSLWQIGQEGLNDELLYISSQITDYHSIHKNRDKYFKRLILITTRVLQKLSEGNEDYYDGLKKRNKRGEDSFFKPQHIRPTLTNSLVNVGTHLGTLIFNIYRNALFLDHWFVLFKFKSSKEAIDTDFGNYTKLVSPKDRFWADPFVVSRNDHHYIFVEELLYSTSRGGLAVLTLDKDGNFIGSKPILEKDYHLSYPNVFQLDGVDYMIPETRENETIDLYRCTDFPHEWKFEKTLINNIQAVDVTPFLHEGKWWIFRNVDEGDGNSSINDEMFLFFTDDLLHGEWKPHSLNPIISDVKRARPAGNIIGKEGKLFRPSQDCSKCYGSALNMNEIIKITETEYEENLLLKHTPDWSEELERIHTYNSNSEIATIDSFYFRKR